MFVSFDFITVNIINDRGANNWATATLAHYSDLRDSHEYPKKQLWGELIPKGKTACVLIWQEVGRCKLLALSTTILHTPHI